MECFDQQFGGRKAEISNFIREERKAGTSRRRVCVQIFDKEQNFLQRTLTTKVSAQYSIIYGNFMPQPSQVDRKSIEF